MSAKPESVHLFFTAGTSDKEYKIHLVETDGGWLANFEYGKRGSKLRPGTMTAAPVRYEVAKAAYDKKLASQLSDGYTRNTDGAVFAGEVHDARFTGIVPQLLNVIDRDDTVGVRALMEDDGWVLQQKHDGDRRLLQKSGPVTRAINRKGLVVDIHPGVLGALSNLPVDGVVLDGEDLGSHVVVFDVLDINGESLRELPYETRLQRLGEILADADASLVLVQTAFGVDKEALLETLESEHREGAVFKRLAAAYVAGRPHSGGDQIKLKFVESASFRVKAAKATKRSVELEIQGEGGVSIPVGAVTIPSNAEIPNPGAIVEVEYLYAFPDGTLNQATWKEVRTDLNWDDCTVSQLKFAPDTVAAARRRRHDI
jgi:bifunctional non-homologous end joining protein LigD